MFAATSVITILALVGVPFIRLDAKVLAHLVRILIFQVVAAGVGCFAYKIYEYEHPVKDGPLPVLVEESAPKTFTVINQNRLWMSSPNVVLCERKNKDHNENTPCDAQYALLKISTDDGVEKSISVPINVPQIVQLKNHRYEVGIAMIGQARGNITDPHPKNVDFVALNIQEVKTVNAS